MTHRNYLKIVLLGDKSTGKTSLMKRYFRNMFNDNEVSTIGAAFDSKIFQVKDKEYQMGVWDTTGEERYLSICSLYYRGADAAVICYDVSQVNTFQKLNYWINELHNVVPECRIYICATKSDLLDKYEANPSLSFAESYALQHDATFVLTSSKTGQNITCLFNEILEDYVANLQNTPRSRNTIRLPTNSRDNMAAKKKCC